MDDSTATVNTTALTPRRPQDPANLGADWSVSMLDRRNRLTITPVYDFTPFKNRSWFLKNIVGNWNLAFTYTFESPELATVQSNLDSNLNGDAVGDRAIVNPSGEANTGSGVTGYDRNGNQVAVTSKMSSAANVVAWVANNPNARYITAGWGAWANSGRNTFPLDPINNVDFGLRKVLAITESKRLELGAQFYNLFNHPQFTGGFSNDVSPQKDLVNTFLQPSSTQFGQYWQIFPSNARYIQVMARITF